MWTWWLLFYSHTPVWSWSLVLCHSSIGIWKWERICFREMLGDHFSKERELIYQPITVWWTQPAGYVQQWDARPSLSWAIGHSWNTNELFLYTLLSLNKFLLTKKHAPIHVLTPSLFSSQQGLFAGCGIFFSFLFLIFCYSYFEWFAE